MLHSDVGCERVLVHAHCVALHTAFSGAAPTPDRATGPCDGVEVALFDLHDWQPWQRDAAALLDPAERARVQRRHRPVDRDGLTLAYALHRLMLGALIGVDAADVPLRRDALGCPRLPGPWHTSLSHTDDYVAVAVSTRGPVGVDIESSNRAPGMPEIAERVCHPDETVALSGLAAPALGAALLALWVRKEALLKAAGIGMAREMDSFTVAENSVQPLAAPATGMTRVQMIDAGPRCVAAVAAPPDAPLTSAWWRVRTTERRGR